MPFTILKDLRPVMKNDSFVGGSSSRNSKAHLDSGKSSDSSLSSTHGYRRLQDGGSLRIGSSQQRNKHASDNTFVVQAYISL